LRFIFFQTPPSPRRDALKNFAGGKVSAKAGSGSGREWRHASEAGAADYRRQIQDLLSVPGTAFGGDGRLGVT